MIILCNVIFFLVFHKISKKQKKADTNFNLLSSQAIRAGILEQRRRLPPLPIPDKKKVSDNVPFFEELFKCTFLENIKSEIVNIQKY